MTTSRVGIIGCGNISPVYAKTLGDFPWIEIAASPTDTGARREVAEQYGGVALELSDMLADDSIDAVVNLTPAHAYPSVSRRCLEAGEPVFSEKPLGTNFDEGITWWTRRRAWSPPRLRARYLPRRGSQAARPRSTRSNR